MKQCKKCDAQKDEGEFYAGFGVCKECHKARVRANRKANAAHYRAYDMERFRSNPDRRAHVQRTIKRRRAIVVGYQAAHSAVSRAVRAGRLVPQACEICADPCTHAHHDDYAKPLEVRWLCPVHHSEVHRAKLKK